MLELERVVEGEDGCRQGWVLGTRHQDLGLQAYTNDVELLAVTK